MNAGMFICFEGIDGSGKTTQIKLLQEYLSQLRVEHIIVREPGGTKAGEEIRNILLHSDFRLKPESELLLFMAARAQIVREVIRPALEKGLVVLADRFMDSSLAYQGIGRSIGIEIVRTINGFAVGSTIPDIIIYIDVPATEAVLRMRKEKKNDKIEVESLEFFEKVRNGYMKIIREKLDNYEIVDGTRSMIEVHECIRNIIDRFLQRFRLNGR
ncbi:MAG TPA: dTMP kinase [Mesotoga sp.]|nr:dTMP kinase [Mesotoga sp.]